MIPLFTTKQIREVDNYAINKTGMPGIILMENAALSIYNYVIQNLSFINRFSRIGFVCSKGNNGGDGFAVARHFANNGFEVEIVYLSSENEMSPDCKLNFNILSKLSTENKNINLNKYSSKKSLSKLNNCNIIFDAILGSGITGDLKEPYKSIVETLNKIDTYKVAIDIPTGLDADRGSSETVFNSDLTITLGEFKRGLFFEEGYKYAGNVVKGDIGINNNYFDKFKPEDFLIEPEDALSFLPEKNKAAYKYSSGKVLTLAGSADLPGAAAMTSKSTLRIGAGASILLFPISARALIHEKINEVIVETYNDDNKGIFSVKNLDEIQKRIEWADVLAIGPGLGRNKETQNAVLQIIKEKKCRKIVVDADAIYALAENDYQKVNLKNLVLTPHHAEFANLIKVKISELKKDLLKYGKEFAKDTRAFLVLKGAPTIVFNPDGEAFINTTGNQGMAKFGTGDVLTGVLAGMIAQSDEIEEAVLSGVYIHSLAADLLLKEYTEYGYTAEDIINNLPSAIKFLRDSIV